MPHLSPPRSLFFKIFAAFLGAQLALALALGLWALANQRAFNQRFNVAASESLAARAQAAAVAYERGGLEALRQAWELPRDFEGENPPPFGPPEDRRGASLWEIQKNALPKLLIGPPAPPELEQILERAASEGTVQTSQGRGRSWLVRRVQTLSGHVYLAAMPLFDGGRPPRGDVWGALMDGPDRLSKLALGALVLALICLALTRTLTAPLRRLQGAARAIARGDFGISLQNEARRQDEIGDLARDMDAMRGQIQSLLENERRLRSDISHELRSPLARIGVALDLASQTADARTAKNLARIREESLELGTLISGLLTLSRLENSAQSGGGGDYLDLPALVTHIAEKVGFEAQGRGVNIRILKTQPLQTRGDGALLGSALENVVRNALLHAPNSPRIEITLERETENTALIAVRDFGPGVPPKALTEIFRPFFRVATARDRETGGTGLGLSIAQRAVEASGGNVRALNAPGGGLRVEMRLPIWNEL